MRLGRYSLGANTTGSYNTAIGRLALSENTTASNNTAVGYQAGYSNTTGIITSSGYRAGYSNTTGANNSFFGVEAGYANTTSSNSAYFGEYSGRNSTGAQNTFYGQQSGWNVTTGSKNTILGRYNGNQGGLDIRTSDNNIVLSDGDGNPRVHIDSTGGIDHKTTGDALVDHYATSASYGGLGVVSRVNRTSTGGNYFFFTAYDDASSTYRYYVHDSGNVYNVNNSYGGISDVKLKENIIDSGSQWDDIKALRVRKYSMKADSLDAPNMLGVIAQELEAAGMGGLVIRKPRP
jgi:trimeric autotransporter adhesin